MKNKLCIISSILVVLYIITNTNSISSCDNVPSKLFYFDLNHNLVTEDLTETISTLDKATNGNIIDILQDTANELDNIHKQVNSSTDNDLIDQMNKYVKVIRKSRRSFKAIKSSLNQNTKQKIKDSIDAFLTQSESTLKIMQKKPTTKQTINYTPILNILQNNK